MKEENKHTAAVSNICPFSGLPIFQKPEWHDIQFDDQFGATLYRLGEKIFVSRVKGYAKHPVIREAMRVSREAMFDAAPPHVGCILIEDLKKLTGVSLEARRYFISDLMDRNNLESIIFCNTAPVFDVIYQLAKTTPSVRKRVFLVDGYRDAVDLAVRLSANKSHHLSKKARGSDSTRSEPHSKRDWNRDADMLKPYVDELLVFLASIHWWEKVCPSCSPIHVDPGHPFKPVFEAITHIRGDLDLLFQKNKEVIEALSQKEKELQVKAESLEELNTALKVLLKKRREDKFAIEEKVIANVKQLIEPYLKKLEKSGLKASQKALSQIISENLREITSPFSFRLASKLYSLTPKEIQVANLVKAGRSSKEISEMLEISLRTVDTHRRNLRTKMGIRNHKANLRTYLLSLD